MIDRSTSRGEREQREGNRTTTTTITMQLLHNVPMYMYGYLYIIGDPVLQLRERKKKMATGCPARASTRTAKQKTMREKKEN